MDVNPREPEEPSPPAWRVRVWLVVGLLLATCVYFHRAVFSEEIFISRDILRVYYPLRAFLVERLSRLEYPDWYPFDGLGQPFVGMVISGAFHPINLLFLVLPPGVAMKLNILLCYPVAVGGVYCFARLWGVARGPALLAGLAYGYSGYLVSLSNNLLYLMAAATFPWVLWAAERFFRSPTVRRLLAAAVLWVLILLGGESQSFAVCGAMVVFLALVRPGASTLGGRLGAPVVLLITTALLALVQLIPTRNVLSEALPGANPLVVAQSYSLHPLRLAELGLGPLFAERIPGSVTSADIANGLLVSGKGSLWSESIHLGALVPLLALLALWVYRRQARTWLVTGAGLGVLLLALGRFGFLYARVFEWVPLWRPFRYPEKLIPYVLALLALGAALGFQRVQRDEALRRTFSRVLLGVAGLAFGLAALETWGGLYSRRLLPALWTVPLLGDVPPWLGPNLVTAALQCGAFLLVAALILLGVRAELPRAGLLCGLQFASLFIANERLYHITFPTFLEQPTAFVRAVHARLEKQPASSDVRVHSSVTVMVQREQEGLSRIDWQTLNVLTALMPVTPTLFGLEGAGNYLPATSNRFGTLDEDAKLWMGRLAGLYGVRFEALSASAYARMGGRASAVVADQPDMNLVLVENPTALPRAYLARPRCVEDYNEAFTLILSQDFRPGRDAAVECGAAAPELTVQGAAPASGEGSVVLRRHEPERVELEVEARAPGLLVLNDAYYRGWTATVDDQPATILPTNVAVRGVAVPAGQHRVVFRYETPGARLAAWISLATLLLLVVASLVPRRRPAP